MKLRETTHSVVEADSDLGLFQLQLIDPGWGSSGYYSKKVLAEAAANKVIPAGTHMHLDHPTHEAAHELPERSVKDLAAVTTTDAVQDPKTGALIAQARVFGPYRQVLTEMANDIGVSIYGAGTAEPGEADGRSGMVVTALTAVESVDFVTHAGRGGKVLAILESARPVHAVEAEGMTANELSSALCGAIRDAYSNPPDTYAWMRDYTDTWVVYDVDGGDGTGTWRQDYEVNDGVVALTGSPVEVRVQLTYVPVPADDSAPTDASESAAPAKPVTVKVHVDDAAVAEALRRVHQAATKTNPQGDGTPPDAITATEGSPAMGDTTASVQPANTGGTGVTESAATHPIVLGEAERLSQLLAEARTTIAEAQRERDQAVEESKKAKHRALVVEAKHAAEKQARTALSASPLTEASHQAVVDRVCESLTVDDDGKVDEKALGEAITAEIDRARRQEAAILEAHGAGVPKGLGVTGDQHEMTESQFTESLTGLFGELGLDEKTAQRAAKGR